MPGNSTFSIPSSGASRRALADFPEIPARAHAEKTDLPAGEISARGGRENEIPRNTFNRFASSSRWLISAGISLMIPKGSSPSPYPAVASCRRQPSTPPSPGTPLFCNLFHYFLMYNTPALMHRASRNAARAQISKCTILPGLVAGGGKDRGFSIFRGKMSVRARARVRHVIQN